MRRPDAEVTDNTGDLKNPTFLRFGMGGCGFFRLPHSLGGKLVPLVRTPALRC